jgi:cytochrome c
MGTKLFTFIVFCGFVLVYGIGHFQENEPPNVKITAPVNEAKFRWNALVPYAISVTDNEDGNSEYDEIPNKEVILMVKYLSDSSKVKTYLAEDQDQNLEVLSWIGSSNCFACHSAKDKLIGPSFEQIADRYQERVDAPDHLAKKIINGATGSWGEQVMPANPNLKIDKVKEIVGWILKNSSNADFTYLPGTNGSFKTREKPEEKAGNSVYILNAHYTDHGRNGVWGSSKKGTASSVLQSE